MVQFDKERRSGILLYIVLATPNLLIFVREGRNKARSVVPDPQIEAHDSPGFHEFMERLEVGSTSLISLHPFDTTDNHCLTHLAFNGREFIR